MKTPKLLALGSFVGLLIMGALFQSQGMSIGGGGIAGVTSSASAVTFDRPGLFPAGTVGAPGIGWSADADGTGTGLYRSAANEVGVSNNGVGSWIFTASGHLHPVTHNTVDIGTSANRARHVYAVGLTVTGFPVFSGGVNLGGGTTITYSVSGSSTLDFADKAGVYGCEELTLTCNGAATTNTPACMVGAAGSVAGGNVHCRVSALNTCAIQYCGTGNPASQTYRATVLAP